MIMILLPLLPHRYILTILLLSYSSYSSSNLLTYSHVYVFTNEKSVHSGNRTLKVNDINNIGVPLVVTDSANRAQFSLFACFERCKLSIYITEATQITFTEPGQVSVWEKVTNEWLEKVRGILEKSVATPKSPEKFVAVLDLYRRATAGVLSFRNEGLGGESYRRLPDSTTEADVEEILTIERRVYLGRQNANSDAVARRFWYCDESEVVEVIGKDSFTLGRVGRGEVRFVPSEADEVG